MKSIYFLYQDYNRYERQSDGVQFCIIPEFDDGKIYFYCSEYSMFWDNIEDSGNFEKSRDFKLKGKIRPATLKEIHAANLCEYVESIKECVIENGKLIAVNYIHLKE